ncbi:MAG: hypothetical protein OXR67_08065 [Chloroflexota bacterium]|nr:hypothetical protein [Chloroflexota bacterium]
MGLEDAAYGQLREELGHALVEGDPARIADAMRHVDDLTAVSDV